MLSSLRLDVRFALRSLVRRPVLATVAVVTLALGIGGATAIFSVVDGVLIREMPYRDASTLVSVWRAWPSWRGQGQLDAVWDHIQFDLPNFQSIRDHATTLGQIEAHTTRRAILTGGGRAEEISVGLASAGLFRLLSVRPVIGRGFLREEAFPGAGHGARLALLSDQPHSALRLRGSTRTGRARLLHTGVVSVQLGFTVVLLVAGGLFARSLARLMAVDPGFEPERLATFAFDVPRERAASDETMRLFQDEVVRAAAAVPGVSAVSLRPRAAQSAFSAAVAETGSRFSARHTVRPVRLGPTTGLRFRGSPRPVCGPPRSRPEVRGRWLSAP